MIADGSTRHTRDIRGILFRSDSLGTTN